MNISFYKSVRDSKSHHIETQRFFNAIVNGVWKNQVEAIRNENDEAKQKAMKSHLPGVRLSGTFSSNNDDSLINHSGLICLDFDEKENPGITDWPDFRDWLGHLDDVVFAALSVRGQGVFAVVRIEPVPSSKAEHLAYFQTLANSFQSVSIKVDESAKNVGRFRFVSYDPNAILNIKAKIFKDVANQLNTVNSNAIKGEIYDDIVQSTAFTRMIDKVVQSRIDITGGYREWFALGCCIAGELGESGREPFHSISQFSLLYDPGKTDIEYNKILRKNYFKTPAAYLFKVAKEHNIYLKNQY